MLTGDQIIGMLNDVEAGAPVGSLWKHKKSGHDYEVIGFCMLEAAAYPAVMYARVDGLENPIWARDAREFLDGRFTYIGDRFCIGEDKARGKEA